MPYKDATVKARVEPEIKEQAEEILDELGVSVSLLVKVLYRQIILTRKVPFSLELPESPSGEAWTSRWSDDMLPSGQEQHRADRGRSEVYSKPRSKFI